MMMALLARTMHLRMSPFAHHFSLNQITKQQVSLRVFRKHNGPPRLRVLSHTNSNHVSYGKKSSIKMPKLSSVLGSLRSAFPHSSGWINNKEKVKRLVGWGGAGGATLLTMMEVIYTYHCNHIRERDLESALAKGAVPAVFVESFVERAEISKQIAAILQPRAGYHSYNMIVGHHGTGKTTLVRHVGHKYPGIVYVDIVAGATTFDEFADSFAKAVHWSPPRHSWFTVLLAKVGITEKENLTQGRVFKSAFAEFCNRAKAYREQTGHCAVLVIDNINRLAFENPKLLLHLQDMAKDAADNRTFITVFVTSEGQAPSQMLARSAISRLGKMLAVGDISYDEVIDLLCKKQGKARELAENIYGLVGGRIKLIEAILNELDEGVPWPEVKALVLKDAMMNFKKVKMLNGGEHRDVGFRIAKRIIEHGRMHWLEFLRIAGGTEVEEILLSSNIFATVPRSDWVTFQSKPAEHVARELLAEMESEGRGKKVGAWW